MCTTEKSTGDRIILNPKTEAPVAPQNYFKTLGRSHAKYRNRSTGGPIKWLRVKAKKSCTSFPPLLSRHHRMVQSLSFLLSYGRFGEVLEGEYTGGGVLAGVLAHDMTSSKSSYGFVPDVGLCTELLEALGWGTEGGVRFIVPLAEGTLLICGVLCAELKAAG